MNRFFNEPRKWLPFVVLAILVKGLYSAWFIQAGQTEFPEKMISGIAFKEADYGFFLYPVDNYFEKGTYTYLGEPYAGRMPGYWLVYFGLRFVFSKSAAIAVLVLLQMLLGAFAVYALARAAQWATGSIRIFYLSYLMFLVCANATVFDFRTLTESFAVSAIVFSAYFLFRFRETGKQFNLFLSGAFMTWLFMLRPFTGPALILPALLLFIWYRSGTLRAKLIPALVALYSFFAFAESAWIARNYSALGKFVPLEVPMYEAYGDLYPRGELAFYKLAYRWGENAWGWDLQSAAGWFRNINDPNADKFELKEHYFSNVTAYNRDSIIALRELYRQFRDSSIAPEEKQRLDELIVSKADGYRDDFRKNNFFRYHFTSRVKAFARYIFTGSSGYLPFISPQGLPLFQKAFKYASSGLYFFILLFALVGLVLGLKKNPARLAVLYFGGFVALNIAVIVFMTTSQESRYFVTCIPMLIVLASIGINRLLERPDETA